MQLGHKDVMVFAAGYPAWKEEMAAAAPAKVTAGAEEGTIDIAAFEKIVKEAPASIMLIDVRDPDEFAAGSFKTAINIPTDALEGKISSLPSDKPVVFVCSTGARSGEAYYMIQDIRPELKNVFYLESEVTFEKGGSYTIKRPAS